MYETFLRPLLFRLDAETSHERAGKVMKFIQSSPVLLSALRSYYALNDSLLQVTLCGLTFPNPLGLAAGFDKYGELVPFLSALGFGHVEIGTITAHLQQGNPRPRLFRLPHDKALINRMGFNNHGADATARTLQRLKNKPCILGINIGKSKITPLEDAVHDYCYSFRVLYPYADYFTINVSSPNTPGLRTLQEKPQLYRILRAIQKENTGGKPVFVKIAPDLTFPQVDDVLDVVNAVHLSGIIVTNTTLSREGISSSINEAGGLSGKPLRETSTAFIRYVRARTKKPIIGVGGIFTAHDAVEKLQAGASLVQIYTSFVYRGPGIAKNIKKGIIRKKNIKYPLTSGSTPC